MASPQKKLVKQRSSLYQERDPDAEIQRPQVEKEPEVKDEPEVEGEGDEEKEERCPKEPMEKLQKLVQDIQLYLPDFDTIRDYLEEHGFKEKMAAKRKAERRRQRLADRLANPVKKSDEDSGELPDDTNLLGEFSSSEELPFKRNYPVKAKLTNEDECRTNMCKQTCSSRYESPESTYVNREEAIKNFGILMRKETKPNKVPEAANNLKIVKELPIAAVRATEYGRYIVNPKKSRKPKDFLGMTQLIGLFPLIGLLELNQLSTVSPDDLIGYVHSCDLQCKGQFTIETAVKLCEIWKIEGREFTLEEIIYSVHKPKLYFKIHENAEKLKEHLEQWVEFYKPYGHERKPSGPPGLEKKKFKIITPSMPTLKPFYKAPFKTMQDPDVHAYTRRGYGNPPGSMGKRAYQAGQ